MNWKYKILFGILAILLIGSIFINLRSVYYSKCSEVNEARVVEIESKIKKEYLSKFLNNMRESETQINNIKIDTMEQNKGEMSALLKKQEELDKITSKLINSLKEDIKENDEDTRLREMNMYKSKENGGLYCAEGYKWDNGNKCILVEEEKKVVVNIEEKVKVGGKCSKDLILTQNLRAPNKAGDYVRNGKYDGFTKGIVKDAGRLQKHLNRLGFSTGKIDGVIGLKTRSAILKLQKHFGVKQDGLIGSGTRDLINNSCK